MFRKTLISVLKNNKFSNQIIQKRNQNLTIENMRLFCTSQNESKKLDLNQEMLNGLNEYKEALQFFQKGKFRLSDEFFKRSLTILERCNMKNTENYIHILKKLALNSNMLRNYIEAETYLEQIIDLSLQNQSNEAVLYQEYNNLFIHCLRTNLNKAIPLGQALLSENEVKNMPIAYQKIFKFNLGTAYLLKGNFVDAKKRLRECISMQPNNLLKGYALNNLAVASWWHKQPNFRDDFSDDESSPEVGMAQEQYSSEQIDKDFSNTIALLKNAITNIENVSQIQDMSQNQRISNLLDQSHIIPVDFKKYDINAEMLFENKESGIPLLNIGEFLFNTNPELKNETTFWFKYALKFFEQNDPSNIDRCLITLALLCSSSQQYMKAEGLFRKALEMLEENDSYNKVLALQLYGNMLKKQPNRQVEAEQCITQSYSLAEQLPFWSNKIIHVCIPNLEL